MGLKGSQIWSDFVADPRGKAALRDGLVKGLAAADIDELIATIERGTQAEQDAAIRVLMVPARWKDPRMVPDARARFVAALVRVARGVALEPPLGPLAVQALMHSDTNRAEELLVHEVEVARLSKEGLKWLVTHLGAIGSARALAKLQELQQNADEATLQLATAALARHGVMTEHEVARVIQVWREKPSRVALEQLYEAYIRRLAEGTPMLEIERRIGSPSRRTGSAWWYEAEGAALYLEQDESGGLAGFKLI